MSSKDKNSKRYLTFLIFCTLFLTSFLFVKINFVVLTTFVIKEKKIIPPNNDYYGAFLLTTTKKKLAELNLKNKSTIISEIKITRKNGLYKLLAISKSPRLALNFMEQYANQLNPSLNKNTSISKLNSIILIDTPYIVPQFKINIFLKKIFIAFLISLWISIGLTYIVKKI